MRFPSTRILICACGTRPSGKPGLKRAYAAAPVPSPTGGGRSLKLSRQSVADFGDRAQLLGRAGAKAKELEVGGNLLEQHLRADLDGAAPLLGQAKKWRKLLLHHDLPDQRRRVYSGDVHR